MKKKSTKRYIKKGGTLLQKSKGAVSYALETEFDRIIEYSNFGRIVSGGFYPASKERAIEERRELAKQLASIADKKVIVLIET